LFMITAISFTTRRSDRDVCREVAVNISNQAENYFLDETDVTNILTDGGMEIITGRSFSELNLKSMEGKLREEPFVQDTEIYRDLKGNLIVNVDLRRPVARIVRPGAPHAYIAADGTIMPVSDKFTSRVMLVSGDYSEDLIRGEEEENIEKVMSMIRFIYEDEFWRGQIAQLDVDKDLNITIYPQVTRQTIEFGGPENLEDKFARLMIFYKEILPSKGWNTYKRVNVEFNDQIIAE
ncbi:MAG: cell division protein FtsQ, partial [Cyclobacteriaceae bacterium]